LIGKKNRETNHGTYYSSTYNTTVRTMAHDNAQYGGQTRIYYYHDPTIYKIDHQHSQQATNARHENIINNQMDVTEMSMSTGGELEDTYYSYGSPLPAILG
jgi:hypothetical protein